MIKAAIEKILGLSTPTQIEIEGRQYINQAIHSIKPPTQDGLSIGTLTSIKDYFEKNPDKIDLAKVVVHVKDPTTVDVMSAVEGAWIQRHEYLSAQISPKAFRYGQYMPAEEFNIAIQTYFVPSATTSTLMQLAGTIVDQTTIKTEDDGTTQSVQAKTGILRLENVTVPNPCLLAPYRTFNEVTQPESAFLFRLKKSSEGPLAALYEADGGNWQLTAIKLIKEYLATALPEGTTILG